MWRRLGALSLTVFVLVATKAQAQPVSATAQRGIAQQLGKTPSAKPENSIAVVSKTQCQHGKNSSHIENDIETRSIAVLPPRITSQYDAPQSDNPRLLQRRTTPSRPSSTRAQDSLQRRAASLLYHHTRAGCPSTG